MSEYVTMLACALVVLCVLLFLCRKTKDGMNNGFPVPGLKMKGEKAYEGYAVGSPMLGHLSYVGRSGYFDDADNVSGLNDLHSTGTSASRIDHRNDKKIEGMNWRSDASIPLSNYESENGTFSQDAADQMVDQVLNRSLSLVVEPTEPLSSASLKYIDYAANSAVPHIITM